LNISLEEAETILRRLDGRGYKAYNDLRGLRIRCGILEARFTRIQGDPFATPSILEARIRLSSMKLPPRLYQGESETPFTDYVSRRLYEESRRKRRKCGSGGSCFLGYPSPGPWIMKRSSVEVLGEYLVLRLSLGLPASGRRILGREAASLLRDACTSMLRSVDLKPRLSELEDHVKLYIDEEYLRRWVEDNGYMLFIGDNSILPRETSLSTRPLANAVPFSSPPSLRRKVRLPSGRVVSGMAVPLGILVVTGGGYHGKTTLLEAVQDGIYDHVEGDGREYVASPPGTMLVKAEDGRLVHSVDISGLISELPGGTTTRSFSSMDASGSTSMAASISEALEMGVKVLLVDEDTSASNLLYKDSVMEKLVENDPIKQLSQLAGSMAKQLRVGLVVVSGASSAFLDPASHVILMQKYIPQDLTSRAKSIAPRIAAKEYSPPRSRVFRGIRGLLKIRAMGLKLVAKYSDNTVFDLDLSDNPRIVEEGQARLMARIVEKLSRPPRPLRVTEITRLVGKELETHGFGAYARPIPPGLTWVSGLDVAWVLNRMYNAVFSVEEK